MISPMALMKKRLSPLALVLILSSVFFVIFLGISGALFFSQGSKTTRGGALFRQGAIGVIEVKGVILDSKTTLEQLDQFKEDSSVKALVVRIDSPGGGVAPSQEIYQALKKFPKPVVASMSSVAASGGYYIALGAKTIVANPGTITGSIGVIMDFINLEELYKWAKVKRFSIKTGRFKNMGADYKTMDEEERELLQTMVNDVLRQFKETVSESRKLSMDVVTQVADGRIFSGSQALELKLVDQLGGFTEAVEVAAGLANIDKDADVVYPVKPKKRLLDLILEERPFEANGQGSIERVARAFLEALGGLESRSGTPAFRGVTAPGVYWLWKGAF